jgi:hypothetical protein
VGDPRASGWEIYTFITDWSKTMRNVMIGLYPT